MELITATVHCLEDHKAQHYQVAYSNPLKSFFLKKRQHLAAAKQDNTSAAEMTKRARHIAITVQPLGPRKGVCTCRCSFQSLLADEHTQHRSCSLLSCLLLLCCPVRDHLLQHASVQLQSLERQREAADQPTRKSHSPPASSSGKDNRRCPKRFGEGSAQDSPALHLPRLPVADSVWQYHASAQPKAL